MRQNLNSDTIKTWEQKKNRSSMPRLSVLFSISLSQNILFWIGEVFMVGNARMHLFRRKMTCPIEELWCKNDSRPKHFCPLTIIFTSCIDCATSTSSYAEKCWFSALQLIGQLINLVIYDAYSRQNKSEWLMMISRTFKLSGGSVIVHDCNNIDRHEYIEANENGYVVKFWNHTKYTHWNNA